MSYISATITEKANNLWELIVYYSYYNLYNYVDKYSYATQQECKDKLLDVRTYGKLSIVKL